MVKNIVSITDRAASHIKTILLKEKNAIGISVGLVKGGCSGYRYKFDYVYDEHSRLLATNAKGVKVFVDAAVELMVIGTTMDYNSSNISAGFVFNNPNVKASCGCGESVML
tara:strand:+ start:139 stop:471 length:333 start_codon:yes stop_codon:yes gene_type:complete